MSLINIGGGGSNDGPTYTVAEVRDLRAAILGFLDVNQNTVDPVLVELLVQTHIMAGHKASDIGR